MKNFDKNIYIYLLLLPFIDLITSLMTRFSNYSISFGMIIKGLVLAYCIFYTIFLSKSKHKKKVIIYLFILFIFCMVYFITKANIFKSNYLFVEITYMFKYMYFPIMTVCLICLYEDFNLKKEKLFKILLTNLIIYSILILFPEFTSTSFSSYAVKNTSNGSVGWFYAANEIGAIMVVLFPYMYYLIFERSSIIKIVFLLIVSVLAMTILGTKTSFLGILITEIIYLIYFFIRKKENNSLGLKISIIIMAISFGLIPNISAINNIQKSITRVNEIEIENETTINKYIQSQSFQKFLKIALSSRDIYFFETLNIYHKVNIKEKLFGIGFTNREEINNDKVQKLIEIDPFDIFFRYGLIGFIMYFGPLVYIFIRTSIFIIKNRFRLSFFKLTNIYVIGIITIVSSIAGHVYGAPSVSIYVALAIAMLESAIDKDDNKILEKRERKKITIMALHLGYGGVEKYISSLCKMLENDYDIEIIATYKVLEKPAFKFSNKIKVTYLINTKPNKEELKRAISDKNIINIIKEGLKSIKILYLKRSRNINAIRNVYSDYIITTRYFHNRMAGTYGFYQIKKIATEHNYHNNDKKYINKVIRSVKGYDYFVVVSKTLREFYKDKIGETKCIYIPNVIDDLPNKKSKLNSNNLITIGRISKEKGQVDLIEVMKIIKETNKDIKLYLIGDGGLSETLKVKVNEDGLKDNIIFTGFLKNNEIEKYILDSSIFVLPSYTESFGLVLIEAMSYGLPIIAFDTSDGARELLKDNVGILIENRDKERMAEEIVMLLNSRPELEKISKTGYDSCQQFLLKNVQDWWLKILKE